MLKKNTVNQEKGFVLIVSMIMLLVLSLLGIWSLATSRIEMQIAGNQQRFDENFNIAEGGANLEATRVGYGGYPVTDTTAIFTPLTTGQFDKLADWPVSSFPSTSTNYQYFVTYLFPDVPPKKYNATEQAAYKFRINGAANGKMVNIELGGFIIGSLSSL